MNNTVPFPEQKGRDDNEQPATPPPPTGWQRFADRAVDWAADRVEEILDAPTYGGGASRHSSAPYAPPNGIRKEPG